MLTEEFFQWRDQAQQTNYPFADTASLRNSENVVINRDLFDDARIHPIGNSQDVYISSIVVTDLLFTFNLSNSTGELAAASFALDGPIPDELRLADAYGRPAGILVSSTERLTALANFYGKGTFTFLAAQTTFVPSVVIPMPQPGLRGFLLDDGNIVAGDVYLVGTDGVVFSEEDGAIRMDVIGDPYAQAKACSEEGFPVAVFCGIRTINQMPPDENGDFKIGPGGNIALDSVVRIESSDSTITFGLAGSVGTRNAGT